MAPERWEALGRQKVDETLEALWKRAVGELKRRGRGHELKQFKRRPRNTYARRSLAESLREATSADPAFGASLEQDLRYLDSHRGQEFIIIVDNDPLTSRVWWVKALVVLAALLMFGGFGIFFYALFQESNQARPSSPGFSPNARLGFALFFAGLCVLALSGLAHEATKTRLD
jgi:hypothetical protein